MFYTVLLFVRDCSCSCGVCATGCCDTPHPLTDKDRRDEDMDVAFERTQVAGGEKAEALIVVEGLVKRYGGKVAVDNVSLAIEAGQCFGLLGVNGAGKTSTFNMLTGQVAPSSGKVTVFGKNLRTNLRRIQQDVGYCPQFGGLCGTMTGREHLYMFARLRGEGEASIPGTVARLLKELNLEKHADKPSEAYSGGNQRKLSTAIALVGASTHRAVMFFGWVFFLISSGGQAPHVRRTHMAHTCGEPDEIELTIRVPADYFTALFQDPRIVFLDEPTTGMDPGSRRYVWEAIMRVLHDNRSVVLTSHSMEECEALCTRLAIMADGRFKCLGPVQHLKNKFGRGYQMIVRLDKASPKGDMASLQDTVRTRFPKSAVKETYDLMVCFEVDVCYGWAELFLFLDDTVRRWDVDDWSLSQASLEQVFMSVVADKQTGTGSQNIAVIFFGWVFFLMSSGSGRTCGEPDEIELTPMGGEIERLRYGCGEAAQLGAGRVRRKAHACRVRRVRRDVPYAADQLGGEARAAA